MMPKSLRIRLVASHILPLLITLPIMGIALIYVLSDQVVFDQMAGNLTRQATLIAELSGDYPGMWQNPVEAQVFVDRISPKLSGQVTLLDVEGNVLSSSDPNYTAPLGTSRSNKPPTANGETFISSAQLKPVARMFYSPRLQTELADIIMPVYGPDRKLIGAIRLTDQLATIQEPYHRMRILTVTILFAGFVLSAALGWVLALDLERPLYQITQAVQGLANGQRIQPLPLQRNDEVGMLAQAFNSLNEQLRALEDSRHQLLANVIHELGRPLGTLRSAIQALLNGADADASFRRELLQGVDGELDRLHRVLGDLALLDRLPADLIKLQCKLTDLREWLPIVIAPRREFALQKGISWNVQLPADLPALNLDPDRMGQALSNLMHNAVRYTPPGGAVTITAGVDQDASAPAVWVCVEDTGPGMTPEEQRLVFEPFYRGRTPAHQPNGMGLGLTIAKNLIAAHGGQLLLESTPGLGSRFTIWLPVRHPGCAEGVALSST